MHMLPYACLAAYNGTIPNVHMPRSACIVRHCHAIANDTVVPHMSTCEQQHVIAHARQSRHDLTIIMIRGAATRGIAIGTSTNARATVDGHVLANDAACANLEPRERLSRLIRVMLAILRRPADHGEGECRCILAQRRMTLDHDALPQLNTAPQRDVLPDPAVRPNDHSVA